MKKNSLQSTIITIANHPLIKDELSASLRGDIASLKAGVQRQTLETILIRLSHELEEILPKISKTRNAVIKKLSEEIQNFQREVKQHEASVEALEKKGKTLQQSLKNIGEKISEVEALAQTLKKKK